MTMALIDFTMPPELICKWVKKVKPFLRCSDPSKQELERTVREVFKDLPKEPGEEPEDPEEEEVGPHTGERIMPFEFLYLLQNAVPRMQIMQTLTVKKSGVEKERLSEFFDGEERRLDLEQIYPFDIPNNSQRFNPREQLVEYHAAEAKDTRIQIDDMRALLKKEQLKSVAGQSALERDT